MKGDQALADAGASCKSHRCHHTSRMVSWRTLSTAMPREWKTLSNSLLAISQAEKSSLTRCLSGPCFWSWHQQMGSCVSRAAKIQGSAQQHQRFPPLPIQSHYFGTCLLKRYKHTLSNLLNWQIHSSQETTSSPLSLSPALYTRFITWKGFSLISSPGKDLIFYL